MNELAIRNRQHLKAINTRWLRRMVAALLKDIACIPHYELAIHAVGRKEIIRLNETFLQHAGATDVIAFDHKTTAIFPLSDNGNMFEETNGTSTQNAAFSSLYGELYVCVEVAIEQARKYRTSWPKEFIRYIVHGLLHLEGYDDRSPGKRRVMKKVEDQRLRLLERQYQFNDLILNRSII
jgi:rRNA maturation RNase YbeY